MMPVKNSDQKCTRIAFGELFWICVEEEEEEEGGGLRKWKGRPGTPLGNTQKFKIKTKLAALGGSEGIIIF